MVRDGARVHRDSGRAPSWGSNSPNDDKLKGSPRLSLYEASGIPPGRCGVAARFIEAELEWLSMINSGRRCAIAMIRMRVEYTRFGMSPIPHALFSAAASPNEE